MEAEISRMINQLAVMALPYLLAVTVPVIAQAYLADYLGDKTPRMNDRLSFDPLKHADPITTGLFPLLSVIFQFPILFGWPKPLPVNIGALRGKNGILMFALVGPVSLILLGVVFALIYKLIFGPYLEKGWLPEMLMQGLLICCFFSVLRLIPIPPSDGAMAVAHFLDRQTAEKYWSIAPYGFFIFIGVLMLIPMVFVYPAYFLRNAILILLGF